MTCHSDQPERVRENYSHIIPSSLETEQCGVASWVYDEGSPSGKVLDFDSSSERYADHRFESDTLNLWTYGGTWQTQMI